MPRFTCTEVTPLCPVSKTTLGYYPNLGANAFFCAGFAVCALWTLTVGVWKRTWAFGITVAAGFALEAIGRTIHTPTHRHIYIYDDYDC